MSFMKKHQEQIATKLASQPSFTLIVNDSGTNPQTLGLMEAKQKFVLYQAALALDLARLSGLRHLSRLQARS